MSDILWLAIIIILLSYILIRNKSSRKDSRRNCNRKDSNSKDRDGSTTSGNTANGNATTTVNELVVQIIVRSDLGMSKGKILSQVMHGISLLLRNNNNLDVWQSEGEAKIVLKGDKNDFSTVVERCKSRSIKYYRVYDAGRTQVATGSNTVLVIGPLEKKEAALITGSLKLY